MNTRTGTAALLILSALVASCGQVQAPGVSAQAAAAKAMPNDARVMQAAGAMAALRHASHGFANMPDRGQLVAYPGNVAREEGAYTWHRADVSEAHALDAMATGHLRLTAPDGRILDIAYDRHVEHASGDWTWIGHLAGQVGKQAILTFGAHAVFGNIAQADKPALRLTVRDGLAWMVETDPVKLAGVVNAETRPQRPDYHIVPQSELPRRHTGNAAATGLRTVAAPVAAVTASGSTVDVVIGYTQGFAAAHGGTSGALTRLNFMVDVTNAAYVNSGIDAQVRLVKAMQVDYTDTSSNDDTLEKVSGYKAGTGTVPPDPAFTALRAAREQYGADLVSVVRDFQEPENGSCGVAWLLGGGLQGIGPNDGWDQLGYSVVSDGSDAGTDGKSYFCLDETFAHELGHNMGAAHDKVTSEGSDGVLDNPGDYGAYTYSFGYKTDSIHGNFYTIMAYGDSGQTIYRIFSDPRSSFCGTRVCGSAEEDNSRTLAQTIPVVAGFRATVGQPTSRVAFDFNGDGQSDIGWRNLASGQNTIWLSANASTPRGVTTVADSRWQIAGVGDFDGDGNADLLWRNSGTGGNTIWRSANSTTVQRVNTVADQRWQVVGIGDFDGDGHSDILWRNSGTGNNSIWRSGSSASVQGVTTVADQRWQVAGVGDFDGDGRSDILWRNLGTGANSIWRSASSATVQAVTTITDQRWQVAGVGDFDGDGSDDILWRNSGPGVNVIWRSAKSATAQAVSTVADQRWQVAEVADFDGDGHSDVLWRNGGTGANTIWLSANAGTVQTVSTFSDVRWQVVGG